MEDILSVEEKCADEAQRNDCRLLILKEGFFSNT